MCTTCMIRKLESVALTFLFHVLIVLFVACAERFPPVNLTEPTSAAPYHGGSWDRDQRVKISTNTGWIMGRQRGLLFSNITFPAYGESLDTTLVVFLYRDPAKTIISHGSEDICHRVRRSQDKTHSATRLCHKLVGKNETKIHAAYVAEGKDIFQLKRYYHHYLKSKKAHNYRIVAVKFEALWTDFDEIAAALCLPKGTRLVTTSKIGDIWWITRLSYYVDLCCIDRYESETGHKAQSSRIDNTSLKLLEDMYGSLRAEIQETPNVVVVDPGVVWIGTVLSVACS